MERAEKVVFWENHLGQGTDPDGANRPLFIAHVTDGRVLVTDAEGLNAFLAAK